MALQGFRKRIVLMIQALIATLHINPACPI